MQRTCRVTLGVVLAVGILAASVQAASVPVFIFSGQSNAVGQRTNTAELTPALQAVQPNVLFYGPTSTSAPATWNPFVPPDETGVPSGSGFGPEITTGQALLSPGWPRTAMVKFASGGTNLYSQWNPNIGGSLYSQMLTRVNQSLADLPVQKGVTGTPAGFFWMQGESDSDTLGHANAYQQNLTNFIQRLRSDLGQPNLPVVLGQINNAFTYTWAVRQAQATVARTVPYVSLAKTDDLQRATGEPIHFSSQGTVDLGTRYAALYQTALAHSPGPASLLANGSFEAPALGSYSMFPAGNASLTGWTIAGSDGVTLAKNTVFSEAPASDGVQWLSLETNGPKAAPNNWGSVSQSFATVPGKTYRVDFDRAALSTGDGGAFTMTYDVGGPAVTLPIGTTDSGTGGNIPSLTMTPWTAKTFTFVATAASTTLRFTGAGRVNGFYGAAVDNVRAYEVPATFLANGGFERSEVGNWTTYGAGATAINNWTVLAAGVTLTPDATFPGTQAREGKQWLSLTTIGGAAGGVRQTFTTVPGETYRLSFDYTALSHGDTSGANVVYEMSYDVGDGPQQLTVDCTGTPVLNFAPWTTQIFDFQADGPSTTLTFLAGAGSYAGFYGPAIDNVTVSLADPDHPIPEPATCALLAMAMGAMGGYVRRRR